MSDKHYIFSFQGTKPTISDSAWIAPGAAVIGDVVLGADASVWFNCTVRGDVNYIRIGARTNIQDNTCIHVTRVTHPTLIGANVTIGHSVTLHGCELQDGCFIGMGATILDGAVVESGAYVAAGALVTPGKRVKSGELWAGSPAKMLRAVSPEEREFIAVSAENYVRLANQYRFG
jgi:carbonic anhydrase/acetyltransferase-like protein (isoleucine patch superfamily)